MGLIKVKILHFGSEDTHEKPLDVTMFVNNRLSLFCHTGAVASFESDNPCIAAFLISDVNVGVPLPFYQDYVVCGLLSPGKQYEIIQADTAFEIVEIKTN